MCIKTATILILVIYKVQRTFINCSKYFRRIFFCRYPNLHLRRGNSCPSTVLTFYKKDNWFPLVSSPTRGIYSNVIQKSVSLHFYETSGALTLKIQSFSIHCSIALSSGVQHIQLSARRFQSWIHVCQYPTPLNYLTNYACSKTGVFIHVLYLN